MTKKRALQRRNGAIARAQNPDLPNFWNISEIVHEAGRLGLPLNVAAVSKSVAGGTGPRVCATVGKTAIFEPDEAQRWLQAEIKRRRPRPTTDQLRFGITEEEFGSVMVA